MANEGQRFAGANLSTKNVGNVASQLQGALSSLHEVNKKLPRRLAGARLAANPMVDVKEQLLQAQEKLKALNAQASNNNVWAESLGDNFTPRNSNHRVQLNANAQPVHLQLDEKLDKDQYLGDLHTYQMLAEKPPKTEYSLAWSVDGSYGDDGSIGPAESLRIARETQRHWTKLISKMEDGALVVNSPVGASGGDFKRADAYMANGFGPVQGDGQQYGQVRSGKIVPLNPFGTQQDHGRHLAKRARMAGAVELSDEMLKQLSAQQAPLGNNVSLARDAKRGSYTEYDNYDDGGYDYEDYEPPRNRDEAKRDFFSAGYGDYQDYLNDPIAMRREIENMEDRAGLELPETLDPGLGRRVFPPEDVAEFRQMQVDALVDERTGMGPALDTFNRNFPRPLPQRITAEDLVNNGRTRNRGRGTPGFEMTPERIGQEDRATRRQSMIESIRGQLGSAAHTGRVDPLEHMYGGRRNIPGKQASVKEAMLDGFATSQDELGNANAIIQMLYQDGDVQAFREVQEALAGAGVYRPDFRAQRQERAETLNRGQGTFGGTLRGMAGDVEDMPAGTIITERNPLTPEQQRADAEYWDIWDNDATSPENNERLNSLRQVVSPADRGPAAPIRRNPMGPDEMEIQVPGAGTLRRPNPYVPSIEELLPEGLRLQPDDRPRRQARVMQTLPQGAGSEFDDLNDLRTNRGRPQISARPALDRGPRQIETEYNQRARGDEIEAIFNPEDGYVNRRRRGGRRRGFGSPPEQPEMTPDRGEPLPPMFRQSALPRPPQAWSPNLDGSYTYNNNGLRENLSYQDELVRALTTESQPVPVEFTIDGRPIINDYDIQAAGYGRTMGSMQDFTRRHAIASPVHVPRSDRFPTLEAAERARSAQSPATSVEAPQENFSQAPREMSFEQFRRWRDAESARPRRPQRPAPQWTTAPLVPDSHDIWF